MVEPVNFYPNPETITTNSYQVKSTTAEYPLIQKLAQREHNNLRTLLEKHNIEVVVKKGSKETPDDLFCNNWISTHSNKTFNLYPMYAPNRRKERSEEFIDIFRKEYKQSFDFTYEEKSFKYLESTGSLVLDRVNKLAYAQNHQELMKVLYASGVSICLICNYF